MFKNLLCIALASIALIGCGRNDAATVSHNMSTEADSFNINRRTVFYNGITDSYILTVEGKCSITKDNTDNQLELLCKVGPNEYRKHFLGLSDNVTYFSEQIGNSSVSAYHNKIIFKPQSIIPDVDLRVSCTDVPKSD